MNYFKEQFSLCASNPKKFWKMVKAAHVHDVVVTDKKHMADLNLALTLKLAVTANLTLALTLILNLTLTRTLASSCLSTDC